MSALLIFRIVLVVSVFSHSTQSIQIGKIQNAMLITNTTYLFQTINGSANDCLCQAWTLPSTLVAINYFSNNLTCELFSSYGSTYQISINSISTLFLIESLPPRQSPENLTWLLDASKSQVQKDICVYCFHKSTIFFRLVSNTTGYKTVTIDQPQNLYIDNYNRLVTNEWRGRLIQMDRYDLTVTAQITLTTTVFTAISYNDGLYYVGTGAYADAGNDNTLRVYNSSTTSFITNVINSTNSFGPIRQCCFARNNTLMLVLAQVSWYSRILLYQINSPTSYTLLNINIQTSNYGVYNIFKVNDTFFYFVLYLSNMPIYKLISSIDGQSWSIEAFVTQGPQPQLISSIAVDSNGRVWAADQYSYIYIYDATTGALLGTFNKIPQPYYILLLNNYELFVSTATNKIYRIPPIL